MVRKRLIMMILALSIICCFATQSISETESDTSNPVDVATIPVYVGTKVCLSCHKDKASHLETGHNWKVTKVVDGKTPNRPFTNIEDGWKLLDGITNATGTPKSMHDISYVIGGYLSVICYVDKDGYVMIGDKGITLLNKDRSKPPIQAVPHRVGEEQLTFAYCARCHTTGYKDYTSLEGDFRNRQRQDNMEGMLGTWDYEGIQCEACHGAGGEHAKAATKDNIVRVATGRKAADFRAEDQAYGKAIACEECHTHDGERGERDPYPYPDYVSYYNKKFGGDTFGGRISPKRPGGRVAADGILGMDPDTGVAMSKKKDMTCITCHNPHQSTVNRDKPGHENGLIKECTDCHYKEFANVGNDDSASEGHMDATCTECHMPKQWHTMKINLSLPSDSPKHLSKDKKYHQPWTTAKMSCQGCHDDYDERAAAIKKIHK